MTIKSLPALPLSRNDISSLAQLLQAAFTHFLSYHSSSEKEYIDNLNVISGCYLLSLIEKGHISIDDERLITFYHYRSFREHPHNLEKLSQSIAEMIFWVTNKLQAYQSLWYYKDFAAAIRSTVGGKISNIYGNVEEAQRLQRTILHTIV